MKITIWILAILLISIISGEIIYRIQKAKIKESYIITNNEFKIMRDCEYKKLL